MAEEQTATATTRDNDSSVNATVNRQLSLKSEMLGRIHATSTPGTEAWTVEEAVVGERRPKRKRNQQRKQSLSLLRAKRFCFEASVVGLRYVANETVSPLRRSVWVVLLIVGAAFTTFQIQDRIRYFLSRPVNVNLRMEHADQIRFPTVTICNENRVMWWAAQSIGNVLSTCHSLTLHSFITM